MALTANAAGAEFIAPSRPAAPGGLSKVEVFPIPGVPEVKAGDDLSALILAALKSRLALRDRDVVVVKQKVVSKAEGRVVVLDSVTPGRRATALARAQRKDPRLAELILRESVRVVRKGHGVIITETRHGFVCANSGVDQSNVERGSAALLPVDPDASARRLRRRLESATGKGLAVVVTDTFGRPWRKGQTDVAIGCSGIAPMLSYAGKRDRFGYTLRVTQPAVADEIAGAAELAMGKLSSIPVAVVRGVSYARGGRGVKGLLMDRSKDLFR
jgi:coenzyme F420-0:L-glutamate ligase / coenzyme F420-1:gamma-L-glutamate ligase